MLTSDNQFKYQADYYIDRWSREDDLIPISTKDDGYVIQLWPHAERLRRTR